MLSDWYFCNCIGINPDKTHNFLSSLEILNDSQDEVLLLVTLEILSGADIWLQIYSLPHCLKLIAFENTPLTVRERMHLYILDILSTLPDTPTIKQVSEKLLTLLQHHADPPNFIQTLNEYVALLDSLPMRSSSTRPYIDLTVFLPETWLLSVLFVQLRSKTSLRIAMLAELDQASEEFGITTIVHRALEGEFGRLALRLAARISPLLISDMPSKKVVDKIWANPQWYTAFEPDLLETTVKILYLDSVDISNEEDLIEQTKLMFSEAITMYDWWRLARPKGNTETVVTIMRRMGFHYLSNEHAQALEIVLWQLTVLDVALTLSSSTLSDMLWFHWGPPTPLPDPLPTIELRSSFDWGEHGSNWTSVLASLATLRQVDEPRFYYFSTSNNPRIDGFTVDGRHYFPSWIFFSPWLNLEIDNGKPSGYEKVSNPLVILRLLGYAMIARRMLIKSEERNNRDQCYLFAMLAHSFHVISSTYYKWLNEYQNISIGGDYPTLPLELTGYALFVRDAITHAGHGKFDQIQPSGFVELLHSDTRWPGTRTADKNMFSQVILPDVLNEWITGAYNSAVGDSPTKQWLELIPEVNGYHLQHRYKRTMGLNIRAELIMRYLRPNEYHAGRFDWRTSRWKWNTSHRLLLLSRDLPPSEWIQVNWPEPEKDDERRESKIRTRAIQRLASFDNDDDVSENVREQWFADFKEQLGEISESADLDRFLRLRLIEILDSETLKDDGESQWQICTLILEFGSLFDLNQLVNRIFGEGDGFLDSVNGTRGNVRIRLVRALYKYVYERDPLREVSTSLENPHKRSYIITNQRYLRGVLSMIAYFAISGPNTSAQELQSALIVVRHASLDSQVEHRLMKEIGYIKEKSNSKQIELENGLPQILLQGGLYNPNNSQFTLFFESIETDNLVNLFDYDHGELQRFINNPPSQDAPARVIGIVYGKPQTVYRNKEQHKQININIGLFWYIEVFVPENEFSQMMVNFSYVHLDVYVSNGSWYGRNLDLLSNKLSRDHLLRISIREYWYKRTKKRRLQVSGIERNRLDMTIWDADLSRVFTNFEQPPDRQVFARFDSNGTFVPVAGDLTTLLLEGHRYTEVPVYVLTLLQESKTDTVSGTRAWLFSTQPGETYLLNDENLSMDLQNEIDTTLEEYISDGAGILVTVTPIYDQVQSRVILTSTENLHISEQLAVHYPELNLPIDTRNIDWWKFFEEMEVGVAHQLDKSGWNYLMDEENVVPGFPSSIPVSWEEYYPASSVKRATMISPQLGDADLVRDYSKSLKLTTLTSQTYRVAPFDRDWQRFLDFWLQLKDNDTVKIERVISGLSPESSGHVVALTRDRVPIRVDVESLSMRPYAVGTRLDLTSPRNVLITHGSRWRKVRGITPEIASSEIPSEVWVNGKAVGILVEVPADASESTICSVLWKTADSYISNDVVITNFAALSKRYVGTGSRITGVQTQERMILNCSTRMLTGQAIWDIVELDSVRDEPVNYLGEVEYDGTYCSIAESTPGKLAILPEAPGSDVPYFSTLKRNHGPGDMYHVGGGFNNKIPGSNKMRNEFKYRGHYRAVLQQKNRIMVGFSKEVIPPKSCYIQKIFMHLQPIDSGDDSLTQQVILEREFRLQQYQTVRKLSQRRKDLEQNKKRFTEYLKAGRPPHSGILVNTNTVELNRLFVPTNKEQTNWTRIVPLTDEPYILDANYGKEVTVRVRLDDLTERYVASVRDVPSYTIELYQALLGVDIDEEHNLTDNNTLHYVGPEVNPDEDNGVFYCFEWQPGQNLLIEESQLRFEGQPFDNADLLLFHGDIVKTIVFHEEITDYESKLVLDILNFELQWSQARTLYWQRSNYRMIHILHLKHIDGNLIIDCVEGFEERSKDPTRLFRQIQNIARLDDDSEERLLNRLNLRGMKVRMFAIMGRLDADRYRDTVGRELVFEHVCFSFDTHHPSGASCLQDQEIVFVQAGVILPIPNDKLLQLHMPNALDDVDFGKDMSWLVISRRAFSVRENVLDRAYCEGPDYFKSALLLVRLLQNTERTGALASFRKIPSRRVSMLRSLTRNQDVFAAWIREQKDEFEVELRPGVHVSISKEDVFNSQFEDFSTLKSGAIVRISSFEGIFRITCGTYSDERYIPDTPRLVVVLPKNNLIKDDILDADIKHSQFWKNRRYFTIGGLPGIEATASQYNAEKGRWMRPNPRAIQQMMETPHPKFGLIGTDKYGQIYISPYSSSEIGILQSPPEKLSVMFQSLRSTYSTQLRWLNLTFSDESIHDLKRRINNETWTYHDEESGYWTDDGVVRKPIDVHSNWTGPVLIEDLFEHPRLRYSRQSFRRYGFPIEQLLISLREKKNKEGTYPVAGVSNLGGVWLEITPGRLVELPGELVVYNASGTLKSLGKFAWEQMAPGDWLTLRLVAGDVLEVDRIQLEVWIPGIRGLLDSRMILPVSQYDQDRGALHLGEGEYTITLPVEDIDGSPPNAILHKDNRLEFSVNHPSKNDIVLLGLDDNDRIIIHGLDHLEPRPHLEDLTCWEDDPLQLVRTNGDRFFIFPRMQDAIRAMGGAFPVTVENYLPQSSVVYFSIRLQKTVSDFPYNRTVLGRVAGRLYDPEHTVLIRVGGGFLPISMSRLIPGLPEQCIDEVVEKLQEERFPIWFTRMPNDYIAFGISEKPPSMVKILWVIEDQGRYGLLCYDPDALRLYWISGTDAAWADIKYDEAIQAFNELPERSYPITLTRKGASLTAVHSVQHDFKKLKIGHEISVRIVKESMADNYLAENLLNGMLVLCNSNQLLSIGKEMGVEVIRLVDDFPPQVITTPVGQREWRIDLPTWITDDSRALQDLTRDIYSMDNSVLIPLHELQITDIQNTSPHELDMLLYRSYKEAQEGNISLVEQLLQITQHWIKTNLRATEMSALMASMAIVVMYSYAESETDTIAKVLNHIPPDDIQSIQKQWHSEAVLLAHNLGRRAMRSMHVEILTREWLNAAPLPQEGLWLRLSQLRDSLRTDFSPKHIDKILGFCQAVDIYGQEETLEILRNSLLATTGSSAAFQKLEQSTFITRELSRIFREISLDKPRLRRLMPSHIEQLNILIDFIEAYHADVVMLDPIPSLVYRK